LLSETACKNGWLEIWVLRSNGKPVAYEYHLRYKDKVHAMRADFDETYRNHHPGSVLDARIVQALFNDRVREYDLGGSADLYKLNWTSHIRKHRQFMVFQRSCWGALLYLMESKVMDVLKNCRRCQSLRKSFSNRR
jgi:CelD/BcsL family acetyltransferase involved in cellulose biosynthesis